MLTETKAIINEIDKTTSNLDTKKTDELIKLIFSSKRVYLSGEGRSGLVISAFANRLTQMGFHTHLASEITAPAIGKNDLIIFNSASGTSKLLNSQAVTAQEQLAKIVSFTTSVSNPLAQKSDLVIIIDAQTKNKKQNSIQVMGSLFEQFSLLSFDAIVLRMINHSNIDFDSLREMHSNLE